MSNQQQKRTSNLTPRKEETMAKLCQYLNGLSEELIEANIRVEVVNRTTLQRMEFGNTKLSLVPKKRSVTFGTGGGFMFGQKSSMNVALPPLETKQLINKKVKRAQTDAEKRDLIKAQFLSLDQSQPDYAEVFQRITANYIQLHPTATKEELKSVAFGNSKDSKENDEFLDEVIRVLNVKFVSVIEQVHNTQNNTTTQSTSKTSPPKGDKEAKSLVVSVSDDGNVSESNQGDKSEQEESVEEPVEDNENESGNP